MVSSDGFGTQLRVLGFHGFRVEGIWDLWFQIMLWQFGTGGGSFINEHLAWTALNYSLPFQVPPVAEAENNNMDAERLMQEERDVENPVE